MLTVAAVAGFKGEGYKTTSTNSNVAAAAAVVVNVVVVAVVVAAAVVVTFYTHMYPFGRFPVARIFSPSLCVCGYLKKGR